MRSHDSYLMYDFGLILIFCIVWTWNYFLLMKISFSSKFVYFLTFVLVKFFPSFCQFQIELLLLGPIKFFVESCFVTMEDGYLVEATKMKGHIQCILPHDDEQLLNAHLVDDFSLTPKLTQNYVEGQCNFWACLRGI